MATQTSVDKETIQIQLPRKLWKHLYDMSESTKTPINQLVEDAVCELVSEYQDGLIAMERLKNLEETIPFTEIEKELGLDRNF
jgi:hypothetical protein